ncbi:Serine/threonine-protein kinase-like protein [Emericellopsis cladophorae]|uniref:Serine/threonine-protein kinase-like protein n=1 Tax=Emericellopsis cladophorae TaxID=2686198 RepID=A0A9P9XZR6_9HYPO|nr:Serine/threonine-protein kinase-like protein [Emericellopsis cladophorae]KAI6780578.1 Serine/threonine-protein kinase-like protein [Emericellopsis cladophorae]
MAPQDGAAAAAQQRRQQYPAQDGTATKPHAIQTGQTLQTSCNTSKSDSLTANSYTPSSPRQIPSDFSPAAILEEGADSEDSPTEPLTPTSSHSPQFTTVKQTQTGNYTPSFDYSRPQQQDSLLPPRASADQSSIWRPSEDEQAQQPPQQDSNEFKPPSLSRRSTRNSTASFRRTMTGLFRRSNSSLAAGEQQNNVNVASPPTSNPQPRASQSQEDPARRNAVPVASRPPPISNGMAKPNRRFSFHSAKDFENKRKNRSSTGLSLRGKTINFLTPNTPNGHGNGAPRSSRPRSRRASSFDSERANSRTRSPHTTHHADHNAYSAERQAFALAPDAGTGTKARRMSLSLPDEFMVDVAELTDEFEYQSKFLGRHGKHIGKGVASKVTLMMRKGCPEELYAVKEFRGKSSSETQDYYDKKVKSEFSLAKSLHHPNIVETFRLCKNHSRWNHVMEYCSEGDLFGLVQKGFFLGDNKRKDRNCIFKQLVQGVHYLHSHGIAHRDIKLDNLLLTADSKLKITDFGVSEVFSGTHPGLREAGGQCGQHMDDEVRLCSPGICGSLPYIAPEVIAKKDKYDPRGLDVWSSGVVLIYLTFGGAIWEKAAPGYGQYDDLVKGWQKWESKHEPGATMTDTDYPHQKAFDIGITPPALRRLLLRMLHPDPAKRININDVISNRWMKGVECCQVESYDDPCLLIDATKASSWNGSKKVFCHSHLPPKSQGHSLGKMPGQPGY